MAPGPFQPPRLRNKAAGVSLFDFLTFPAMQDKSCRSDSDDRPSSKWSAAVAREEQPEDRPRCSSQAPRDARLLATRANIRGPGRSRFGVSCAGCFRRRGCVERELPEIRDARASKRRSGGRRNPGEDNREGLAHQSAPTVAAQRQYSSSKARHRYCFTLLCWMNPPWHLVSDVNILSGTRAESLQEPSFASSCPQRSNLRGLVAALPLSVLALSADL